MIASPVHMLGPEQSGLWSASPSDSVAPSDSILEKPEHITIRHMSMVEQQWQLLFPLTHKPLFFPEPSSLVWPSPK